MNSIEKYYMDQAGGGGKYYIGRHQRGHGIGSLFASLFRTALPIVKPLLSRGLKAGAKAVGRYALKRVADKITESPPSRKRPKRTRTRRRAKKKVVSAKVKRLI